MGWIATQEVYNILLHQVQVQVHLFTLVIEYTEYIQ